MLRLLLVNLLAHPGLGEDKKHIKKETWDGAGNDYERLVRYLVN